MDSPYVGQEYGFQAASRNVSPYFFPQRKMRNVLYLPKRVDLPSAGTVPDAVVFDFGFDAGNLPLGPLQTGNDSVVIVRPTLIKALAGFSDDATVPYLGFLLQFFTQHEGNQRQWFNKHIPDTVILGDAKRPHLLHNPQLLLPGDSIQAEVKNLNRTASAIRIQVILYGTELDI